MLYLLALFVPPVFLHLTFALLDLPKTSRERLLLRASYAVSVLFLPALPTAAFIRGVLRFQPFFCVVPGPLYTTYVLFFGTTCAIGFIKLLKGYRKAIGVSKNQLRYIFVSWFFAYVAGLLHFMPAYFHFEPFPHDFLVLAFVPISAYAIVRYRLLDIRLAFARTTILALVYTLVLGIPFFVGYVGQEFLAAHFGRWWWTVILTLCTLFATAGPFLYMVLQRRAEERLLAEQRRYQAILRQASQSMTLIKELNKLLRRTVALLTKEVGLSHVAIYLWDPRAKKYVPKASRWWKVPAPPMFGSQDALLRYFDFSRNPAVAEELHMQARGTGTMTDLREVVASLRALRAAVVVPSFVEKRCIGFLVLGEKRSGALYTPDDLAVFQVLANQAALAVENAIFYEELKRTQADLFQTAKMADLGRMAGGMSHQINNRFHVLTILAGTVMSYMKDVDPKALDAEKIQQWWDKVLETFKKVEDNALRGGNIVQTLLKFSRPSGEFKPATWPKIAATALEVVQHRVDLTRFDLKQQFPEGLAAVNGDHNLLADSLFNLISNAYDAMEHKAQLLAKGELTVHLEDPSPYRGRLVLRGRTGRSEDGKDWVVLEVADNGLGMTPEELECLFIPFFTTKGSAAKGTGLGLFVIQRVIERHGGTISCQSEYGVGTTFTIRLPVCANAPEAPTPPQEKPNA